MQNIPEFKVEEKRQGGLFGNKLILAGLLIIWSASILLALELKTLLTPGNFPIGTDPSFDITLAAFCFVLCILGALLLWRGLLNKRKYRLEEKFEVYLNLANLFIVLLLVILLVTGGLLFSANNAFAAQYKPGIRDEPSPGYSVPAFPNPVAAQPTPTYDPESKFLAGPITSELDGLRVGDMWISMAPDAQTIHYIQVYIHRIECDEQQTTTVNQLAVDKSEQLISGPIPILADQSFYAGQDMVSVHGIAAGIDQANGTIHLEYIDPANKNRACDLGSYYWSATLTAKSH